MFPREGRKHGLSVKKGGLFVKHLKSHGVGLLLAAAVCVSLLAAPASAAGTGVTAWNDSIGGKTAQIVSVEMTPGRTGVVSLANNSVVEAAPAKSIIDAENAKGHTVVAAINGGFFNSYTKGAAAYPDNCPLIMNAVVKDGMLVHSGNTATLGFTADGKAMVDWVTLKYQIKLGNGFVVGGDWGMNAYLTDPWAIMLFDEHLTLPVNVPASSTMFYIQNGQVIRVVPGGSITVPAGTHVLVYNSAVYAEESGHDRLPAVGMSADIQLTASGTDRDSAWAGVKDALVGGPLLVKNGANVVDGQGNQGFYGDPKQRPDVVSSRSFVGVTANGGLVMGTATASFRQIADWLVAHNIREGLAMDGGASSMLYANGAFTRSAGRNLASVLTIVDTGSGTSTQTPAVPGGPSSWAVAEIQSAISAGLVPQDIQSGYQSPISRQDFCRLIWELLKKQPDISRKLQDSASVSFSDTSNEAVLSCARLGVISGVGEGRFEPGRNLKRSEAAKILALTTQLLGVEDSGEKYSTFTDRSAFGWAEQFIDYCGVNGIMNGEDGAFNPEGTFSREQAIATVLRIGSRYGKA